MEWPSLTHLQITNAREGVEKRVHSYSVGGNVNWYNHDGKKYLRKTKYRTTIEYSNPTPGHVPHSWPRIWTKLVIVKIFVNKNISAAHEAGSVGNVVKENLHF